MAVSVPGQHPSAEICYDLSVKSLEQLVSLKATLDGKALALLGGASALITFIPALAETWVKEPVNLKNIPFALAIVLFGFAAYFLLKAYWPKPMISAYHPQILLDQYAPLQPEDCQVRLLSRMADYFNYNHAILSDTVADLKMGFILVIAETAFLIIRLLLS